MLPVACVIDVGPFRRRQRIVDIARRVGLRGTTCARWRADTIRFRLPELAGRIKKTVRRIRLCLASAVPLQDVFARTLVNLHSAPGRRLSSSRNISSPTDPALCRRRRRGLPGTVHAGRRSVRNRLSTPSDIPDQIAGNCTGRHGYRWSGRAPGENVARRSGNPDTRRTGMDGNEGDVAGKRCPLFHPPGVRAVRDAGTKVVGGSKMLNQP